MAYESSRVKEHVMLPSDSAYNTLKTTGSYTDPDTGTTITYNEHTHLSHSYYRSGRWRS